MFNKIIAARLGSILYYFTHPPNLEGSSIELPKIHVR